MRPCERFIGGKRQFPDGQHHKKPPRLTTARLWLHFPKKTALLPTISFDSFFLAWQRYPILLIFMFPLWASIQKNHGHLKDYPISELSCFIRNKLSQEEAHIPNLPKLSNDLFCCPWQWLDLQWSNCQPHPRTDGDPQIQMLAHQRIRSMGSWCRIFLGTCWKKSSTI